MRYCIASIRLNDLRHHMLHVTDTLAGNWRRNGWIFNRVEFEQIEITAEEKYFRVQTLRKPEQP